MSTKVIFRKFKDSEIILGVGDGIIACFPEIPADEYGYSYVSYMHIGQHGAANHHAVVDRTVLATEDEYADLKQELESIGYDLEIYQKQTSQMREVRKERAEAYNDL